jgi:hypothetical protein
MGLRAGIFKRGGTSFSNGGVSESHDELTLVNVAGPFEERPSAPAALLVRGNMPGTVKVVIAEECPVEEGTVILGGDVGSLVGYRPAKPREAAGPMMGGCYVAASDSRFGEACEELGGERFPGAVPLHDRFESSAQYASYD